MSENLQIWRRKGKEAVENEGISQYTFRKDKPQEDGMYTFQDLKDITEKLRSEKGCSWEREQTHESLKLCLLDECKEVLLAVDHQDKENLCEELGDVLYLVLLNSRIAEQNGDFTIEDVINGVSEKMVRRHPHVFGGKQVNSREEEMALWKEIKKQEKAQRKPGNP